MTKILNFTNITPQKILEFKPNSAFWANSIAVSGIIDQCQDDDKFITTTEINSKANPVSNLGSAEARGLNLAAKMEYETNSKSNKFLKEYLEKRAKVKGVKIPDGVEIEVSSPKKFSDDYKKLARYVRTKIYGARLKDMINFMQLEKTEVKDKVAQMKISDADKGKIIELKTVFDSYYKIEANYKGEKIKLTDLSKQDKEKLEKISPEFSKFIEEEQEELKKHTVNFTQKEANADELSEAGFLSRVGAPIVMAILSLSIYRGIKETRQAAKAAKDLTKFLAEQTEIYKAGKPLFVNPIKAFAEAVKGSKAGKGAAIGGAGLLASYLWKTLIGSLDDLAGAAKDSVQDADNFGIKTSAAINIPAAIVGVLSSAFIAPTIDAHIQFNCAEKHLLKNGLLPKLKGSKKFLHYAKKGVIGAALGVVIAACSSGSSWASMLGTRIKFGQNGKKLAEKNIISKEENTAKSARENMMQYEAYYGKWDGIAKGDPTIGTIGGGLGLFTSTNPYLQNLSFGLQGCSETLTACAVQLAGNKVRENKLDKEKQALVASVKA